MIAVTGAAGQLGRSLMRCMQQESVECIGADINDFDITDGEQTMEWITRTRPDAVIHCAVYSNVERAEKEPRLCHEVNVIGTKNVAAACHKVKAKMLYLSSDYVFDGTKEGLYETDDAHNPLSVYGKSKSAGEFMIKENTDRYFIVRISWLFGEGSNFVRAMLRQREKAQVTVVNDQIGSPTYAEDVAPLLCRLLESGCFGTYHATNEGFCSFAEWAQEIFRLKGITTELRAVPSGQYPTLANRPLNSRLSKTSLDVLGIPRLPHWQDALARYLADLPEE